MMYVLSVIFALAVVSFVFLSLRIDAALRRVARVERSRDSFFAMVEVYLPAQRGRSRGDVEDAVRHTFAGAQERMFAELGVHLGWGDAPLHIFKKVDLASAALSVLSYWDYMDAVPGDDERPATLFKDEMDKRMDALRNSLAIPESPK